jgi:hypothetical protein
MQSVQGAGRDGEQTGEDRRQRLQVEPGDQGHGGQTGSGHQEGRYAPPFGGEALRRIGEGAAMIRTKGEAGTGDIVEAVRHMRTVQYEIRRIRNMGDDEIYTTARELGAPLELDTLVGVQPCVEPADCARVVVVLRGIADGAAPERVVDQQQAAPAQELQRLLVVAGVARLVRVDEDHVDLSGHPLGLERA